jgi:hypothetical protein
MPDVKIVKQIEAVAPNRIGTLAAITKIIAAEGVNILAMCAYTMEKNAVFMLITDDNKKASGALEANNYKIKEEDVVLVSLVNRVGSATEMTKRLKDANIDLLYLYGSSGESEESLIVFKTNNDPKAVKILKEI